MDNLVLDYIERRFKPESLDPVFIADDEFNIPEKDMALLNERIEYNFADFDYNGTTLSHAYMQRVYNGNMHDSDALIKYMKRLNVKVNTDINVTDNSNYRILSDKVLVHESRSSKKALNSKVSSLVRKFTRGDITPDNIKAIGMYINTLDINYTIGEVYIYSKPRKSLQSTEYFIAIPYTCSYKAY